MPALGAHAIDVANPVFTGAKRIVVKVGSSSISGANRPQIEPLVDGLAALRAAGSDVVLVSSGAIATGMPFLQLASRPGDLPTQQAAAAVGQNVLMNRYQRSLTRYGLVAAQILLSAGDFGIPKNRVNAHNALERLLELEILPIVNENDTVATHEIRFGDNDRLASLVAVLLHADVLVLLSDVDGLYTAPPESDGARRIAIVPHGDALEGVEFGASVSGVGTGGASTKVQSARAAADSGTAVLFTSTARFADVLGGADVGTLFHPGPRPAPAST